MTESSEPSTRSGQSQPPATGNLPVQRLSYDWSLPQSSALFQCGPRGDACDNVEALPLHLAITEGGSPERGRRVAARGVLGEAELTILGRVCQTFFELGCPPDEAGVPIKLGALASAGGARSGSERRAARMALQNLARTTVVIPGFNPTTQEMDGDFEFEGTLLQGLVTQRAFRDYEELLARARRAREDGESQEAEALEARAHALSGSLRGQDTLIVMLPTWMTRRMREQGALVLDAKVQRSLRGNQRNVALALEGLTYEGDGDAQTATVTLTAEVYESMGLNYAQIGECRRVLARALERILWFDAAYEVLEIRPHATLRRVNELHVRRYTGQTRQRRLRRRAMADLQPALTDRSVAA